MNLEEKKQVKACWVKLSMYYQYPLQDAVVEMYADDLSDLSFNETIHALNEYRLNPKNNRVPLPGAIRALVIPIVDDDSIAREAASRIISAIKKFGWPSPTEAKEYIGELGWRIVERNGGWSALCENLMENQIGIFQAQARDLAKTQVQFSRADRLDEAPGLPGSKNVQINELISNISDLKRIQS